MKSTGPTVELRVERDGDRVVVRSGSLGIWTSALRAGELVNEKSVLGTIEILGRSFDVALPAGAGGRIISLVDERAVRRAVCWDDVLFELDPNVGGGASVQQAAADAANDAELVFRAPSSGRFYSRPEPGKPPFVSVGQTIEPGAAVCMLEVMKTYSRVRYDGDSAVVIQILPQDEDDLEEGDVILELKHL